MEKKFYGHSNKGGIYKITNKINKKIYVGSAKCFKRRAYHHLNLLTNKKHSNKYLQRAFDKHGSDNFLFEVIEVIFGDKIARTTIEQKYIDKYLAVWDQCYNIEKRAVKTSGPWSNSPAETGKKISKANIARWSNPKYKAETSKAMKKGWTKEVKLSASKRMSGEKNPMYGKTHSKETIKKISTSSKGKKYSNETRKKISDNTKNQWNNPDVRDKMIKKIKEAKNKNISKQRQSILTKIQWKNPDIKSKMSLAIKKSLSKVYFFTNPEGKTVKVKFLKDFCKNHNLSYACMLNVHSNKQNHHKKWTKL